MQPRAAEKKLNKLNKVLTTKLKSSNHLRYRVLRFGAFNPFLKDSAKHPGMQKQLINIL